MEELGRILRRARSKQMWTQDMAAKTCGLSRQAISRYEAGAVAPGWGMFVRILAAYGLQPRIQLDPLDADVAAATERQRRQPAEQWLADVPFSVRTLHKLLAGLEWQASGLLAVRLLGAPAPLSKLEAIVVLDDEASWERLVQNAREGRTEVWDPDDWYTGMPIDVDDTWTRRVLDLIRRRNKLDDSPGETA